MAKDMPMKSKMEYLKTFRKMNKDTPSMLQYHKMSGTERGLAKAGVTRKEMGKLMRKKK